MYVNIFRKQSDYMAKYIRFFFKSILGSKYLDAKKVIIIICDTSTLCYRANRTRGWVYSVILWPAGFDRDVRVPEGTRGIVLRIYVCISLLLHYRQALPETVESLMIMIIFVLRRRHCWCKTLLEGTKLCFLVLLFIAAEDSNRCAVTLYSVTTCTKDPQNITVISMQKKIKYTNNQNQPSSSALPGRAPKSAHSTKIMVYLGPNLRLLQTCGEAGNRWDKCVLVWEQNVPSFSQYSISTVFAPIQPERIHAASCRWDALGILFKSGRRHLDLVRRHMKLYQVKRVSLQLGLSCARVFGSRRISALSIFELRRTVMIAMND